MTEHIVNVPARTIGKDELAEILGISPATLDKRPSWELPPPIAGYKNRWYYPAVDRWLMERSAQASTPSPRSKKPSGF